MPQGIFTRLLLVQGYDLRRGSGVGCRDRGAVVFGTEFLGAQNLCFLVRVWGTQ